MQLSVPPSLGQHQFQPQGFSHPVLGAMTGQMGQFNPGYSGMGNMGNNLAPGMGMERPGGADPRMGSNKPSELLMPGAVPPPDLSPALEPRRSTEDGKICIY